MAASRTPGAGGGPDGAAVPGLEILQGWADDLARRHFGVPFDGRLRWAPRLRHRAGDFTPGRATIRLSLPYFLCYGAAAMKAVLLHELCHWFLLRHGIDHREDASAFQELLALHGAPARAAPRPPRGASAAAGGTRGAGTRRTARHGAAGGGVDGAMGGATRWMIRTAAP